MLSKKCLKKTPSERIGAKDIREIKNHLFFKNVDWEAVKNKTIQPLIKPMIKENLNLNSEKTLSSKG